MRIYFLVLIIFICSCSKGVTPSAVQKIEPGITTIKDVISWLNEPDTIIPPHDQFNSETYIWDDLSIQIEKQFVKSIVRPAYGDETSIQHWFYQYKKNSTHLARIDENNWKLEVPSEGITVMYDKQQDKVTKVIHYEVE
jgi:hypothetical protein